MLATPNTLVAALKTIALSWQQETLAENAREVRQLGAELYERLRTMTGHMESLQRSLSSTVEAYNKAVGSFESRVLVTARKFPALGVVGMQSGEIDELAPIEKAPRHLQTLPARPVRRRVGAIDHRGAAGGRRQHRHGVAHTASEQEASPSPIAREHRRRTLPGCCTSTDPSGPTRWWPCCADLVAEPLDDPMVPEVVSCPTRGIERWLTQRLSAHLGATPGRQDGVCANIDFPFPGDWSSTAPWPGRPGTDPDADPWLPATSGVAAARGGRGALRRAVAGAAGPAHPQLRDGARVQALLEHPARGRPLRPLRACTGPRCCSAGPSGSLGDEDEAPWQVELWRLLRDRIGQPSPAERLVEACRRLRDEPELLDLPPRLSLFGLTRLPASYLDVLEAMGAGRDVHLFLLHPSPALWERLETEVGPDVALPAPGR